MRHIELHYTGAILFFLLFSATGALKSLHLMVNLFLIFISLTDSHFQLVEFLSLIGIYICSLK